MWNWRLWTWWLRTACLAALISLDKNTAMAANTFCDTSTSQRLSHITISTPNYPSYYTSPEDRHCICTIKSNEATTLTMGFIIMEAESDSGATCRPYLYYSTSRAGYYTCARSSQHVQVQTISKEIGGEEIVRFNLTSWADSQVNATLTIKASRGSFNVRCETNPSPSKSCPCRPITPMNTDPHSSTNRVPVLSYALPGFILLFLGIGAVILLFFINRKRNERKEGPNNNTNTQESSSPEPLISTITDNPAYERSHPDNLDGITKVEKPATRPNTLDNLKIPFKPDPSLKLDMQIPTIVEPPMDSHVSRHTDSGAYNEPIEATKEKYDWINGYYGPIIHPHRNSIHNVELTQAEIDDFYTVSERYKDVLGSQRQLDSQSAKSQPDNASNCSDISDNLGKVNISKPENNAIATIEHVETLV